VNDDVDWESFAAGLIWGIGLVFALVRLELWLRRPAQLPPPDPFETLRWEVLQAAREATRDAAG
jgi:hypothetical protein